MTHLTIFPKAAVFPFRDIARPLGSKCRTTVRLPTHSPENPISDNKQDLSTVLFSQDFFYLKKLHPVWAVCVWGKGTKSGAKRTWHTGRIWRHVYFSVIRTDLSVSIIHAKNQLGLRTTNLRLSTVHPLKSQGWFLLKFLLSTFCELHIARQLAPVGIKACG